MLQPISNEAPPQNHIQQLLVSRYGGLIAEWKIRRVSTAYLIHVPTWLSQDEFYLDTLFWAIYHLEVLPWQTLDSSSPISPTQRICLTIHDFPVDFLHPSYLRQATTGMGVLIGYASSDIVEGNLARVRLLIETLDPSYVPPSICIFHNGRVSVCLITMNEEGPADPPTHPQPPPNVGASLAGMQQYGPDQYQQLPYLPPWGRRIMRLPPQVPDAGVP